MEKTRTSWLWVGLIILIVVGVMAGLDPSFKLMDSIIATQNRETVGTQKIIPLEGKLEGPFSLSLEVVEVSKTIKGILVIKLDPNYSLVNLELEPDNEILLVYKSPDGIIETAGSPIYGWSYKGISIEPIKFKVLESQK